MLVFLAWCIFGTTSARAFYNPQTGRWLSRDPSAILGTASRLSSRRTWLEGGNADQTAYAISGNDVVNTMDVLGLVRWTPNKKVADYHVVSRSGGGWVDADVLEGATDKGRPIQFWKSITTSDYWCHGYTFDGDDAPGGP